MNARQRAYELFVFDFDGTLADSRRNIVNSVNAALTRYELALISPDRIIPYIGKLSIDDTFLRFYPRLPKERLASLTEEFRRYQRSYVQDEAVLFPGVAATLGELKRRGKQVALLTTKHIDQIRFILQALKLDALFDAVYGDGIATYRKPSRLCMQYIWDHLPVPVSARASLMVGDSSVDVESAKNAGVDFVGVAYGIDGSASLRRDGAGYIIASFSELLMLL